jgi:hypothetical protein
MSICIAHRTQRIVKFYLDPFVPSLGVCASSDRGLALKTGVNQCATFLNGNSRGQ